jgi:hypothetical protein
MNGYRLWFVHYRAINKQYDMVCGLFEYTVYILCVVVMIVTVKTLMCGMPLIYDFIADRDKCGNIRAIDGR